MEFLALLLICLLIAIVVMPFVAFAKANEAQRRADVLSDRLARFESELRKLKRQDESETKQAPPPVVVPPAERPEVKAPPVGPTQPPVESARPEPAPPVAAQPPTLPILPSP